MEKAQTDVQDGGADFDKVPGAKLHADAVGPGRDASASNDNRQLGKGTVDGVATGDIKPKARRSASVAQLQENGKGGVQARARNHKGGSGVTSSERHRRKGRGSPSF